MKHSFVRSAGKLHIAAVWRPAGQMRWRMEPALTAGEFDAAIDDFAKAG